ncbi:MAG: hypothetical protein BWY04_01224 [candidate division CPR1 bacterium ADurb.Bin160]|uniref:Uncharacterized protein n=1 Tax=candidate division CPR1 bacterium ADurb.Bin160 TaxID=1852826 RepID=A0A1V5ZKE2_9BACT|nr:MAG: hypothetical protein BWY04_01224 [candidate division CPR1 bacterium ADurb.Bin160]
MDKKYELIEFDISIKSVDYHRGEIPLPAGTITCNEEIYEMFVKETGLTTTETEAFNDFYDSILTQPQSFGTAYIEFPVHKGFCVSLGISRYDYKDFKEIELYKFPKLNFTQKKYDKACDALGKIIKLMKQEIMQVKERMEEEDLIEQEQNIIDEFMSAIICKLKYSKFAEDGKNKDLLVNFVYNLLDEDFIDVEKVVNYKVTEEEIIKKIFENYDVINGKIVKKLYM